MREVPARTVRDDSIDLLRGLVMIVMALDHTRDFFGGSRIDPTDLAATTAPLFLTRWITHFCAPVFVFLAGVSARIAGRRRTPGELAGFLASRGLWLVFVECTIVRIAWSFDFTFRRFTFQVIWVIGASMLVLAALVRFRPWVAALFGAVLVVAHDAFDHVHWSGAAWHLLHDPGMVHASGWPRVYVLYPLVPWVGVMALGYAFGGWLALPAPDRRRRSLFTGLAVTALFVALRALNIYGDPERWHAQSRPLFTVLSFLNCEKYPPSLLYLAMTLGPALIALGLLGGRVPRWTAPIVTFGRVPFFYYVLHLYLIHGAAVLIGLARGARDSAHTWGGPGFGLPGVSLAWITAVLLLYPACAWFAGVKARRRDAWLSYV